MAKIIAKDLQNLAKEISAKTGVFHKVTGSYSNYQLNKGNTPVISRELVGVRFLEKAVLFGLMQKYLEEPA